MRGAHMAVLGGVRLLMSEVNPVNPKPEAYTLKQVQLGEVIDSKGGESSRRRFNTESR